MSFLWCANCTPARFPGITVIEITYPSVSSWKEHATDASKIYFQFLMKCYLSTSLSLLGSRLCASDKLHSSTSYLFLSDQSLEVNSLFSSVNSVWLPSNALQVYKMWFFFLKWGWRLKCIPISSFVQKFNTCSWLCPTEAHLPMSSRLLGFLPEMGTK